MAVSDYALTSVADVKTYLQISVTTYDTLFENLINECTDWIEHFCGNRRFKDDGTTAVTEYHDGAEIGRSKHYIFPKRFPINTVTSVSYRSNTDYANPTWTAYSSATDYIVPTLGAYIYFPGGLCSGIQSIKLVYRGGFTTIPYDLALACIKMVAKEYGKRKAQGVLNESVGGASISWNEDVSPDVLNVLNYYRNYNV